MRSPQPIEALVVSAGERAGAGSVAESALELVGRTIPILPWQDGGALVLFPLCDPGQVARACDRLRTAFGAGSSRRMTITAAQLVDMAPLDILTGAETAARPIFHPAPVRLSCDDA